MNERYEVRRLMQPASGDRYGIWDAQLQQWVADSNGETLMYFGRPAAEDMAIRKNSEPESYLR